MKKKILVVVVMVLLVLLVSLALMVSGAIPKSVCSKLNDEVVKYYHAHQAYPKSAENMVFLSSMFCDYQQLDSGKDFRILFHAGGFSFGVYQHELFFID